MSEKGRFETQIAEEAIAAALESVKKAKAPKEGEGDAPAPAAEEGGPVEGEQGTELDLDSSEGGPDLELARKVLKEKEIELELSTQRGRETMERLKETHERLLRASADLENYKKRAAKERDETLKFGSEKLLKDLLPVMDNLDRALDHSQGPVDPESLRKGVELTRKSFEDILERHGVKGFSAVGQPFDPHMHEAMSQVEVADKPAGTVVNELLRGFTLNGRLVRPAMVVISCVPKAQPPAPPAPQPSFFEAKADPFTTVDVKKDKKGQGEVASSEDDSHPKNKVDR